MQNNLQINTTEVVHWFNAIRNLPPEQHARALDAFWAGQIESKAWLVQTLNTYVTKKSNIYIFGGWIGVLANLLLQSSTFEIGKIRSIDVDPWCEPIADNINKLHEMDGWRFKAVTCDMANFFYQDDLFPDVVINTSSEHVTKDTYLNWYDRIPLGSLVVVQGNNFYDCGDHIRCSANLEEFKADNCVRKPVFEGEYETDLYTRYMCIWYK